MGQKEGYTPDVLPKAQMWNSWWKPAMVFSEKYWRDNAEVT